MGESTMKGLNFVEDDFDTLYKRNGGLIDDGAYIIISHSRIFSDNPKHAKRRQGMLHIADELIDKVFPGANTAILMSNKKMLAIKLGIDIQDRNAFAVRKFSKFKKVITSSILKKISAQKYFEKDVMVDFDKKVIAVNIEYDKELDYKDTRK